jgi:hypothetical protein
VLDSFFGNVCELDLVFNFYKVCATSASWFGRDLGSRGGEREGRWRLGDGGYMGGGVEQG